MRLDGSDVTSWSAKKQNLLRHMFILDLIRDFNKFVHSSMVSWALSTQRTKETLESLHDIINRYKKNVLYTVFTEEEAERYKEEVGKTDEEIISMVADM